VCGVVVCVAAALCVCVCVCVRVFRSFIAEIGNVVESVRWCVGVLLCVCGTALHWTVAVAICDSSRAAVVVIIGCTGV
jgi:hypothetical protein